MNYLLLVMSLFLMQLVNGLIVLAAKLVTWATKLHSLTLKNSTEMRTEEDQRAVQLSEQPGNVTASEMFLRTKKKATAKEQLAISTQPPDRKNALNKCASCGAGFIGYEDKECTCES